MFKELEKILQSELTEISKSGLWKEERIINSPQGANILVQQGEVINFCANNYLGLANHPKILSAAKDALETHGYGMASVRFICGTSDLHKKLEKLISDFLKKEETILYSSCFDANAGLFETLLTQEDAIISDQLNHASIIDGVRLCKAQRYRYAHADMDDLDSKLKEARKNNARVLMVATDGVFSMDGDVAKLREICDIAEDNDAVVMVDDSHATGFFGPNGRGTPAFCNVEDRVDIVTSTLGKALGGASGGFTTAHKSVVDLLRNRSRPYLFSNSLAPVVAAASIAAINLLSEANDLRSRLQINTTRFRKEMTLSGFDIRAGEHPIVPIMLGDAELASNMAKDLLEEGIYVIGFSYPVVPVGAARIRVQISAAHTDEHIEKGLMAFKKVGKKYGVI